MGMTDWSKDLEDAAREAAGNWRKFENFGWDHYADEDAKDWTIVYTSNRDSGIRDQSNEQAILKEMEPFTEGDDPDVRVCRHGHWAVGHVDGLEVRVRRDGEVTPAFRKLYELAMALASYPLLDESDHSRREYEGQLECIANEVYDGHEVKCWKTKESIVCKIPEEWEETDEERWEDAHPRAVHEVWEWIWDNEQEAFYYDADQPCVKDIAIIHALQALGWVDEEAAE